MHSNADMSPKRDATVYYRDASWAVCVEQRKAEALAYDDRLNNHIALVARVCGLDGTVDADMENATVSLSKPGYNIDQLPESYGEVDFVTGLQKDSKAPKLIVHDPESEISEDDKSQSTYALLDDVAHVETALLQRFSMIYLPSSRSGVAPASTYKDVFDNMNGRYFRARVARDTPNSTLDRMYRRSDMERCFIQDGSNFPAFNILDAARPDRMKVEPEEVFKVSILDQLDRQEGHGGRSTWQGNLGRNGNRWLILTHGPYSSPFHVDSAGRCTLVVGLQGHKIWHWPNGMERDREAIWNHFAMFGTGETRWPDGVSRISIGRGDMLFQGPGMPHAVHTSGNSMIAGFFFYTAATFHTSIACIARCLKSRLISNDDMCRRDWEDLGRVLTCFEASLDKEMPTTVVRFTERQTMDISREIWNMLDERGVIVPDALGETNGRHWKQQPPSRWKKKSGLDTPGPEFVTNFLKQCASCWTKYYETAMSE